MEEIWKKIEDYTYEISNFGNIRQIGEGIGIVNGRILKHGKNRNGYLFVFLSREGKRKQMMVHQLVASSFILNPMRYTQINHKDENKNNNLVSNLEWCTQKYNNDYSKSQKVMNIKTGIEYKSINEASRLTKIHPLTIKRLIKEKEWIKI